MTGRPELGCQPLQDTDVMNVRRLVEARFVGGLNKENIETGLKLSLEDIRGAMELTAKDNSYHPVREFLTQLKWDGHSRIDNVIGSVIRANSTALNRALFRRFMISCVARAMKPGAKVDTVLVLIGPQGILKSTAFRILAGSDWFIDSPIDISKKDALEQLRYAWIIEWAELESLFRARDSTAVKAFLSSQEDTYRPSYGRFPVTIPRSCVIVGTTNQDEFLTDETGSRRFWPLRIAGIDQALLAGQRLQLWAEAVALYASGEQWWLTPDEERQLGDSHDQHRVRDAWEELILTWVGSHMVPFTTGDVLSNALEKPTGQWNRADEMRVAKILKTAGWDKKTDPANKDKGKRWFPPKR
jgi:putative DNA primase/helicase